MIKNLKFASTTKFALAALVLVLSACSDAPEQNAGFNRNNQGDNIPAVDAVQAIVGSLPLEERVTGRATARNQTEIYPEAAGTIMEIFVENGDAVIIGDPLVRLRDAEFSER